MRRTSQEEGPKRRWKVTVSRTFKQVKTYELDAVSQDRAEELAIDRAQFNESFPKDQKAEEWTFVVRDVEELEPAELGLSPEEAPPSPVRRLPERQLPEEEDLPLAASTDWDVREL